MKPLIIYHANCADGFGAAFAAWLYLGDEAEYKPCAYGDKDFSHPFDIRENVDGRDVYILDFSFHRETMDHIFANASRVIWLDHHKTAFEMWCPTHFERGRFENYFDDHFITLDNNKSGAMLAWEYFHTTEVPRLIQHIDDYDRWQFKIEGTKAFNKALWSYAPWTFEQWEGLVENEYDPETMHVQYVIGNAILRAHDQNVQSVVRGSARECALNPAPMSGAGLLGLSANCPPHLTSDVGHELATQSGTFGLCWYLGKGGTMAKCSLRSNGDYDVSAIAQVFGGGGHRNAAGFEVPIGVLLGWLK